jgi:hypothetical protein
MKTDYIASISSHDLSQFVGSAAEPFPNFTTVNDSYADQLNKMKNLVGDYFQDETLNRPFSYLILGPPGAGKSFLMKSLVEKLKEDQQPKKRRRRLSFAFQSINLSEVVNPSELYKFYEQIQKNSEKEICTVTLLDEVDVRWGGSSAIKHLINPMYDGEYWNGAESKKFGRCAFFFAGSYLQDRETLLKTQKLLIGLDLSKFLLDMYLEMRSRDNIEAMRDLKEVQEFCYAQHRWRADLDPRADTIVYLRNLEKIKDFLSRIAGNFFEMIDVSAPLHVTHEAFVVSEGEVKPTPRLKPIEVTRFIKRTEIEKSQTSEEEKFIGYREFGSSSEPIREYKNVLLCERLLRVSGAIEKRFKKSWPDNLKEFKVQRKLLNLLTVAPLINGMRSLEQLVNLLDAPDEENLGVVKRTAPFKLEEISMIINNAEDFSDPSEVWYQLKNQNSALKNVSENDLITIPIKRKS